jgi:hypothetical protein
MQTRLFIAILIFGIASVALAQGSGGSGVDVSKIAAKLKQFDANGNGIIEQDEADKGGGVYIEMRVFRPANIQPHYPIAINDLLQIAGGQAPSGSGSISPPAPASTTAAPTQPSAPAAAPSSSGGTASAPAVAATPSTSTTPVAGTPTSSSPIEAKPPTNRSGKWRNAQQLLPKGLPDWFLKKADADGQITMAEYTDRWTPEALAEFQKYDLNHDGIITAAEVLKAEKPRGRR